MGFIWHLLVTPPLVQMEYLRKIDELHEVENNTSSCTYKEIRKFQMTLGNYYFSQGDLQTVVNYDSFEGKVATPFVNIPFEQGEDVTIRRQ